MAVTTRTKPAAEAVTAADLAGLRAALQTVARVTANVAAQGARSRWDDFGKLLSQQYSVSPADAGLFLDILAGRKP